MVSLTKFAAKMAQRLSVAVRMTIFGLVTSAPPMGNAMVIQMTHVDASMQFLLGDNTASRLISTVRLLITG